MARTVSCRKIWNGAERTGLLHRSPAPDIGAGPRLLLVIDPIG
ncbi:MAG: DUF1826 domain-containing protein [Roseibium album]